MVILIVDDDDVSRALLRGALECSGYDVSEARSATEALEILAAQDVRMVISDWQMPEMSGVDLCRRVREGSFDHYTYFILLTVRASKEDVVEGLTAGADDFMTKPFDRAELSVRIRAGERVLALETREMAIFAMAKLAESRDQETGTHLERIRAYCRVVARGLLAAGKFPDELDDEFERMLFLTSPLHDIGKVGIPDSVLLKPGRLDDDEFAIMKTHTLIGAETLDAALSRFPNVAYLRTARDIAVSHHERYDGHGYPHGLSGAQIPLAGRIVAVADVYDALTSRRVYKPAFTHTVARNIIRDGLGTHFDPTVAEVFLSRQDELQEIRRRYADDSAG